MIARVRQLISQLSYPTLVSVGVVPNLALMTPDLPSKRYPPWLYALSKVNPNIFSDFGLFVEEIIYQMISNGSLDYPSIWSSVCCSPVPDKLTSSNNYFKGILDTFRPMFDGHSIKHGPTLSHELIEGHPDFFCDSFGDQTWIIDVKTTTGFAKMADQTYLQILAYSALARANGYTNNYIGVLLPIQRQIVWYDVSNWDSSAYLSLLLRESRWFFDDVSIHPQQRFTSHHCGSHCRKEDLITYAHGSAGRPLQVFLSNPRGKSVITDSIVAEFSQELPLDGLIFVHAPYIINLSNDEADNWNVQHLSTELTVANTLQFKGVVVHVGKYKQMQVADALNIMESKIREILIHASPDCPLILETPAGQGTELCTTIEELLDFYQRFQGSPNFRICIDSCHVFASGYDPVWYLETWLKRFPESIVLVHFNDSETPRGSRVDRHAIPGLGYIGYRRMQNLHDLCLANNIPMVRE